jgi:hypothetical protein
MLNMFRVFSADERAPAKLGQLAKTVQTNNVVEKMDDDGMFYYESEVIACFNMMTACRNVLSSKTSVKEDIRGIN